MTSQEIRNQFIQFFRDREHKFVRSSGVVPFDDPTLLFTNAGMNQFKGIFLGKEEPRYARAVNSQKCIRVSGKHNDLEEVGRDTYHHTFFEMLGNWSFGDYYKTEAIRWAWELFTDVWGIPKDKLYATVYHKDDEARTLWAETTDIDPGHILPFGEKDNFWEMGETGPCGPCSELHVDIGGDEQIDGTDPTRGVNTDNPRFMELWNLVFIQYNRDSAGALHELPARHVDTGAGLERIVAYLQGKRSNYDTDLFTPILQHIADLSGVAYKGDEQGAAHRVIADHLRMLTFSIADGALPANDGRGYVLRRILRRAARFGRNLGLEKPFVFDLVPTLVEIMGSAYPEIGERSAYIQRVIRSEEESFAATLGRGIQIFNGMVDEARSTGRNRLDGAAVFRLYDTFGFPVDLVRLMAGEEDLEVDEPGFEARMAEQRKQARKQHRFKQSKDAESDWTILTTGEDSEFLGYTHVQSDAVIRRYRANGELWEVVLDQTPFYAESGGQVGDSGQIQSATCQFEVVDTVRDGESIIHRGRLLQGEIDESPVVARIDAERRAAIRRNHSATHLMNAALRTVLGDHVKQAGSLVDEKHLRFDFNHFEKVSPTELKQVEQMVNQEIRKNLSTLVREQSFDAAREEGALAFFGEKYGDEVRTIKFGEYSYELCGGTHVTATGDIGYFRILSESGVAAGVRRIEASSGKPAELLARRDQDLVKELGNLLNCEVDGILERVDTQLSERKQLEKELKRLQLELASDQLQDLLNAQEEIRDIPLLSGLVTVANMDELKELADELAMKYDRGVGVLGAVFNDAPYVVCIVSQDLIATHGLKAGNIVRELGRRLGGGGGGKPHMATAGGKDPDKLADVLGQLKEIIGGMLDD